MDKAIEVLALLPNLLPTTQGQELITKAGFVSIR